MDWAKGLIYLGSICGAIAAIKKLIIPYFGDARAILLDLLYRLN